MSAKDVGCQKYVRRSLRRGGLDKSGSGERPQSACIGRYLQQSCGIWLHSNRRQWGSDTNLTCLRLHAAENPVIPVALDCALGITGVAERLKSALGRRLPATRFVDVPLAMIESAFDKRDEVNRDRCGTFDAAFLVRQKVSVAKGLARYRHQQAGKIRVDRHARAMAFRGGNKCVDIGETKNGGIPFGAQ